MLERDKQVEGKVNTLINKNLREISIPVSTEAYKVLGRKSVYLWIDPQLYNQHILYIMHLHGFMSNFNIFRKNIFAELFLYF